MKGTVRYTLTFFLLACAFTYPVYATGGGSLSLTISPSDTATTPDTSVAPEPSITPEPDTSSGSSYIPPNNRNRPGFISPISIPQQTIPVAEPAPTIPSFSEQGLDRDGSEGARRDRGGSVREDRSGGQGAREDERGIGRQDIGRGGGLRFEEGIAIDFALEEDTQLALSSVTVSFFLIAPLGIFLLLLARLIWYFLISSTRSRTSLTIEVVTSLFFILVLLISVLIANQTLVHKGGTIHTLSTIKITGTLPKETQITGFESVLLDSTGATITQYAQTVEIPHAQAEVNTESFIPVPEAIILGSYTLITEFVHNDNRKTVGIYPVLVVPKPLYLIVQFFNPTRR